MGNGKAPAGIDLDRAEPIDDGTSARIGSPTPAPIGLDAKNGTAKQSAPSMADQIVSYARRRLTTRVGNGQCFTLVDGALRGAHAQSAADYGTVTPDADYTWGTPVSLTDLQPGDVIQFRDYTFHKVVVTESDSATGPKSDLLAPGASYNFTFNTVGTFQYRCTIHPTMTGTVTVTN